MEAGDAPAPRSCWRLAVNADMDKTGEGGGEGGRRREGSPAPEP